MQDQDKPEIDELVERISDLTKSLLSQGADPGELVFSLTSVATNMGLHVCNNPIETFYAQMTAIGQLTGPFLDAQADAESVEADPEPKNIPVGATVH